MYLFIYDSQKAYWFEYNLLFLVQQDITLNFARFSSKENRLV